MEKQATKGKWGKSYLGPNALSATVHASLVVLVNFQISGEHVTVLKPLTLSEMHWQIICH